MTALIRPYAQIANIFIIILMSLIILVWLCHSSVNLYWQQTYHRDSPFLSLNHYKLWQKGDHIYQSLISYKDHIGQRLTLAGGSFGVANPTDQMASGDLDNDVISNEGVDSDALDSLLVELGLDSDKDSDKESDKESEKESDTKLNSTPLTHQNLDHSGANHTILTVPENSKALFKVSSAIELIKVNAAIALPHHQKIATLAEQNVALDHVILHKDETVFFVGDSLMQGVAPHIQKELFKKYGIKSINLSKQSTGLAYIGFFNWPAKVTDTFQQNSNIKLMVVFLGPNDPWDIPNGSNKPYLRFKSPEWNEVYQSRVNLLLDKAIENGARVIWVGAPNMKKAKLNTGMAYLNQLYQTSAVAKQQIYIDINSALGAEDEKYVDFIQVDNRKVKVRTDDGIHFTRAGQVAIAQKVLSYIEIVDDKSVEE